MRLLIFAALLGSTSSAISQVQFHPGSEPSKRAKQAMPLARCIWRERYFDTLAFVNELERAIKATAAVERLSALELACPKVAKKGDIIAALVYNREAAVADCIAGKAASAYRNFLTAGRGKDGLTRRTFINDGFPEALRSSAEACDKSLTFDFARQERTTFAARIWDGWR